MMRYPALYDIDIECQVSHTLYTLNQDELPKYSNPVAACFMHFPGNRSEEQKASLAKLFSEQYTVFE